MSRTSFDDRDYMVPRMAAFEAQVLKEIADEQVHQVSLAEYQPGSPHLEKLYKQMADAQRWRSPRDLRFNF